MRQRRKLSNRWWFCFLISADMLPSLRERNGDFVWDNDRMNGPMDSSMRMRMGVGHFLM